MNFKFLIIITLLCITFQADKDYLKEAAHWVDIVYKKIYESECKHEPPAASTFEEISKKKKINCVSSASITYQQAGLLDKGKKVGHTKAISKNLDKKKYYDNSNLKKSILLTFTNPKNLKKGTCDFVKVMKKYSGMPDWLKQKGILYVQDSNICVSAGNNKIYSCNATGKTYGKGHVNVLKTSAKEYAFSSLILWAVVPRSNGKSNVPNNTPFKHLPCGL